MPKPKSPAKTESVEKGEASKDVEMIEHIKRAANHFGLIYEKTSAATRNNILGKWKSEDIKGQSGCGGILFEFKANGSASTGMCLNASCTESHLPPAKDKFVVKKTHIEIKREFPDSGGMIFKLSGNFYAPSRECGFTKLKKLK